LSTLESLKLPATLKRKTNVTAELADLLRIYPTLRLRALVLQRVLTILRSLRGNCPEYLREFTYCRTRLSDLQKGFDAPVTSVQQQAAEVTEPGRDLFPAGCQNLEDAVNRFLQNVTAEELLDLDQRVQTVLRRQ